MKFMFETKAGSDRFQFSGPQIHLELSVGRPEPVQLRRNAESDRQRGDGLDAKIVLPFVITNQGPLELEITRLEFCTWRDGLLVEVSSRAQWYNGENFLPPSTMYSDRRWFNAAEMPQRITGQISVRIAGEGG